MAKPFQWSFRVINRIAAPTRAMTRSLVGLRQEMRQVRTAAAATNTQVSALASNASAAAVKVRGLASALSVADRRMAATNANAQRLDRTLARLSSRGVMLPTGAPAPAGAMVGTGGTLTVRRDPEELAAERQARALKAQERERERALRVQRRHLQQQAKAEAQALRAREREAARADRVRAQARRLQARENAQALRTFAREQQQRAKAETRALRVQQRERAQALRAQQRFERSMSQGLSFLSGPIGMLSAGLAVLATGTLGLAAAGAKFAADALIFKESTLAGLKVLLGTDKLARDTFREALAFAKSTPFDTKDVLEGYTSLLGAGFSRNQVGKVFAALGDVAAASGFDKQVIDRLTIAFAQIKAKGRLQGEEMLQVLEASGKAGVGATRVYEQIAKRLGIATTQVADAISKGRVDSDTGILAILEAIQQRSGGKVGSIMLAQSKTLKGLLSTLASAPEELLMSLDLEKLPGYDALKGFVSNLVKVFDSGSVAGQRLLKVAERLVNTLFGGLFGELSSEEGLKAMEAGVLKVADVLEAWEGAMGPALAGVKGFFEGVRPALAAFMEAVGEVFGQQGAAGMREVAHAVGLAIGRVVGWVLRLGVAFAKLAGPVWRGLEGLSRLTAFVSSLTDVFALKAEAWGQAITSGLALGLQKGLPGPLRAMAEMVGAITKAYTVPTQTHSPSRLFASYGGWAAKGWAGGFKRELPQATGAVEELASVGEAPLGSAAPRAREFSPPAEAHADGGGGGVRVVIQSLVIQTGGTLGGGEAGKQQLEADVQDALQRVFEKLGMQLGVA